MARLAIPNLLRKLIEPFQTRYGRVLSKLGFAVFDQAFFAGSNFVINILLARWMTLEQYGAFAVAYAWFLLPANFYEAALIEPMNVFGAGKYYEYFKKYLGFIYRGHVVITLIIAIILGIGAALSYSPDNVLVASAIAGTAIAAPFILTRWLTRFPFYVMSKPYWPISGSIIYMVISIAGLLLLNANNWLNPFNAILVMALGSIAGSTYLTFAGLNPDFTSKNEQVNLRSVIADHWDYGKWSTTTRSLDWVTVNFYILVLPMFTSLGASAAIKAISNLALPILMAISAMTSILLPTFVRKFNTGGIQSLTNTVKNMLILYMLMTGAYAVVMVAFGPWSVNFLFNGQYDSYISIPLFVAVAIQITLQGIISILDSSLRATGYVKWSFFSKIMPTIVTLTVGTLLLWRYGFAGAYLAPIVVQCALIITVLRYYRKMVKNELSKADATRTTSTIHGDS
jgi:O-antigen/teichoic acid export membrane protein